MVKAITSSFFNIMQSYDGAVQSIKPVQFPNDVKTIVSVVTTDKP